MRHHMGLLYTKYYLDFPEETWSQRSNDPVIFEALQDKAVLELSDMSQREVKIEFKKGGKIKYFRVVGKYRLTWDDEDIITSNVE